MKSTSKLFSGPSGKADLIRLLKEQKTVLGDVTLAEELAEVVVPKEVADQEVLIHEGERESDLYFILDGTMEFSIKGRKQGQRTNGNTVGEMAAIQPAQPRSATVKAVGPSIVATLSATELERIAHKYPSMWQQLARELSRRLLERNRSIAKAREKTRVFVISSREAIDIVRAIENDFERDKDIEIVAWKNDIFKVANYPSRPTGAMDAFGRMGWFCRRSRLPILDTHLTGIEVPGEYSGVPLPPPVWWTGEGRGLHEHFINFLRLCEANTDGLVVQTRELLRGTPLEGTSGKLSELLTEARETFTDVIEPWIAAYEYLVSEWEKRKAAGADRSLLNSIAYQARELHNITVIEQLATLRFLPRYGFPIGLQALRLPADRYDRRETDVVKLQRDGTRALNEYVPGSRLLAGGRVYTSRGLVRSFEPDGGGFGVRHYRFECVRDHVFYDTRSEVKECRICGDATARQFGTPTIVPRFGYLCAAWDPPSWSGDPTSVGEVESVADLDLIRQPSTVPIVNFGTNRRLQGYFCEGARLFAANAGPAGLGFAICTRCGYSLREHKLGQARVNLPPGFEDHAPLWSPRATNQCWKNGEGVMRNQSLGAETNTDVLQVDVLTGLSRFYARDDAQKLATTLSHALRLSGAQLLEVEPREISARTVATGADANALCSVHVFDSAAGGSGHTQSLLKDQEHWLGSTIELLKGDSQHQQRCSEACLQCLLDSQSQGDFEAGLLDRKMLLEFLSLDN